MAVKVHVRLYNTFLLTRGPVNAVVSVLIHCVGVGAVAKQALEELPVA